MTCSAIETGLDSNPLDLSTRTTLWLPQINSSFVTDFNEVMISRQNKEFFLNNVQLNTTFEVQHPALVHIFSVSFLLETDDHLYQRSSKCFKDFKYAYN